MTRHILSLPALTLMAAACQPSPLTQLEAAEEQWLESGTITYSYTRTSAKGVPDTSTFVDIVGGVPQARTVTDGVGNVLVQEVEEEVGLAEAGDPALTMIELYSVCRALLESAGDDADIDLVTRDEGGLITCIVNDLPGRGGYWTGIVLDLQVPLD